MAKNISPQRRFELYISKATEIEKSNLVQSGMRWKINLSGDRIDDENWEMKSSIEGLIENDLKAFLLDFRHLTAQKEPIFINKVFNDAIRYITDENLKRELVIGKDQWNSMIKTHTGIEVRVDGELISTNKILDLWINGQYFHSDQEKAEILNKMNTSMPLGKAHLLIALPPLTKHALILAKMLENALSSNKFIFSK